MTGFQTHDIGSEAQHINLSNNWCDAHQRDYINKKTSRRGISLTVKQDAVDAAHERYSFFFLINNKVKDSVTALSLYWVHRRSRTH